MVNIEDYKVQKNCTYKGELYSVRDNGAIMRHKRKDKKKRPQDEVWTFGTSKNNGYAFFCHEGVHRIVATAFHGDAPSPNHIVDHYDTNRQNNRPENLRWLTKLENILNNPHTRSKVIHICGSIENFLNNPDLLYGHEILDENFSWMRAVTSQEAKNTLERMDKWLSMPYKEPSKMEGNLGDWIFTKQGEVHKYKNRPAIDKGIITPPILTTSQDDHTSNGFIINEIPKSPIKPNLKFEFIDNYDKPEPTFKNSLTANSLQVDERWKTPTEFPLCPNTGSSLEQYYSSLEKGKVVTKNDFLTTIVEEAAMVKLENSSFISVICKDTSPDCIKEWSLIKIFVHDGMFAHQCEGTFFNKDGAQKYHIIAQGKEWTGGDVFDDYCS